MNSGRSKRVVSFRPELVNVIAALRRGEDVANTLAPWIEKFTQEEWNKVMVQTGDVDWELVLRIFSFLKEKSVFGVQHVPLGNEDDK